jgi:hypothetical protein
MDGKAKDLAPRARQRGLIVRELDGELLIYDRERDQAHALTGTAAAVWKACDGLTTVEDMIGTLPLTLGKPIDEYSIYRALAELSKQQLLEDRVMDPGVRAGISRRNMLLKTAGAAAAIPLITSLGVDSAFAQTSGCPTTCPSTGCVPRNCPDVCAGDTTGGKCCPLVTPNCTHPGCVSTAGVCGICTGGCCQVNGTCVSTTTPGCSSYTCSG